MNLTAKKSLQRIGIALTAGLLAYTSWFLLMEKPFVFFALPYLLLLILPPVLFSPFTGFTFTDAIDFGPVAVIALAFVGLAIRHALRPHPEAWTRFARRAAYVLAVLPPTVYLAALYGAAGCAAQALGHFPQPMLDDPHQIIPHDFAYQRMHHVVNYTEAFAGAVVWVWVALLLHLRERLTGKNWAVLVGLFLLAWLVFMIEPGRRFEWWLD